MKPDRTKILAWLNLPKGDTVKLSQRNHKSTMAVITTKGGATYHYRIDATPNGAGYTLSDAASSTVVSDRNGSRDAGDYAEARIESTVANDVADRCDDLTGELQDTFHLDAVQAANIAKWHCTRSQHEATTARAADLARLIAALLTRQNARLAAAGMSYAAGLDAIAGKPMTATARELGVTRAAVSKEANYWSDTLGLPRSRYMRSADARRAYRDAQLKAHHGVN